MSILGNLSSSSWNSGLSFNAGYSAGPLAGRVGAPLSSDFMQLAQSVMGMSQGSNPVSSFAGFGGGNTSTGLGTNLGGFLGNSSPVLVADNEAYVPSGLSTTSSGNALPLAGGGQAAEAVQWATSQMGVTEGDNPDIVRGYSNGADQAWCADFVSKSFENTGGSPFDHQMRVQNILDWGKENDRFTTAAEATADPESLRLGDIAVWKDDGKSHVGLLTGINDNGTFTTIEGNTSQNFADPNQKGPADRVAPKTHAFEEEGFTGFVRAVDEPDQQTGQKPSEPGTVRPASQLTHSSTPEKGSQASVSSASGSGSTSTSTGASKTSSSNGASSSSSSSNSKSS